MSNKSRRQFLKNGGLLSAAAVLQPKSLVNFTSSPLSSAENAKTATSGIITVNGIINSTGFTLAHEHVLVDFIGADKVSKQRYNAEEVFKTALPKLKELKGRGCATFVDCTPAYLGRDVILLKRLSTASGLNLLTNTGYYGAAKEKYLPKHAYEESSEAIAKRWIAEFENGIEGTGIKPGFIKCAVDAAPLSSVQIKMIEAAAITHLETGLTIYVHTGNGVAAREELQILSRMKVHPSAWVWVHAQSEKDRKIHFEMATAGAWISFDGVSASSIPHCLEFLNDMKKKNLLKHVLLSQDSGWYHVGEPQGGTFNDYNTIHDKLLPALKQAGYTADDLDLLFKRNPQKALNVQIKRA